MESERWLDQGKARDKHSDRKQPSGWFGVGLLRMCSRRDIYEGRLVESGGETFRPADCSR